MMSFGLGQGFGPLTASGGGGGTPPVGASLAIVDNEDGTGAVATIAGAAGYSNEVFVYELDGTFLDSFSRSGNGAVALAITDEARYIAILVSDDFLSVGPTIFTVSDGAPSYAEDVHDQVLARIQSLPLTGIDLAHIVKGKHPLPQISYQEGTLAGILVATLAEQILPRYNSHDDVGYGFLVVCWSAVNQQNNTTNLTAHQKWREQIATACKIKPGYAPIPHERLSNLTIEPASPMLFNPEAFLKHNTDAAALVLRVFIRQPR